MRSHLRETFRYAHTVPVLAPGASTGVSFGKVTRYGGRFD